MPRRFVFARRVCVGLLTVSSLIFSPNLSAYPFPGARATDKPDVNADKSSVFVIAPSISVLGHPTSIAAGDLNGDGVPDLVVANEQTGSVDVLLGDGNGKFLAAVHYKVGGSPVALVLADLSGRGKIDIAVANRSGNSVNVLLGKGDGTFHPASTYPVGLGPVALTVGKFSDGSADLLVANAGSNTVALLANKGDGTFQSARFIGVTASPRALAVADFNGDGNFDVATGNVDGTVNILLGDGEGRLNLAATISASTQMSALVAGDFNGDGKYDLAVADPAAGTVSIFLGHGDGTFQSASVCRTGNEPVSLVLEDVNADGLPDLLAVNKSGNTVSVMLGAGDGTFQPSTDYVVGNSPMAIAVADFNGDGHLDFATANFNDGSVSVPLGNGNGTFRAAQSYRTHLDRKSVAVGDLDGDGHADVVVASFCGSDSKCNENGTASVFLSNGKGSLRPASIYGLGKGPISIALADVNGDKKLDLIALNRDEGTVMVLPGNGDGTFQQGLSYSAGSNPVSVSVGDFNKDGKPDLAIATLCGSSGCHNKGSLNILLGNGDGSFTPGASYDVGFSPTSVTVADVNGDGALDLIVANSCGKSADCAKGTASVLIGDGKGTFTPQMEVDLGKLVSSVALADLNGDGMLDLISTSRADNELGVLLGKGDGTFSRQVSYPVGTAPSAVLVADFDGDGILDVAVANQKDSTVSLLRGNGDGSLQAAVPYPVGFGPDALAALDLTGTGRLALVTANGNGGGSPVGNDITVQGNASTVEPPGGAPAPVPTSISPTGGALAGGTAVTIAGTGFVAGATVTFGGTAATNVVVVNATTITATTPAHAAGEVDVVVTNPDAQFGPLTNGYTYAPAPNPTSVTPSSGPAAGGTAVTIAGTHFVNGATVTFGGTTATNVVVVNATTITATTPAHAAGAVDVVVTNPDTQFGTFASGFTYAVPPTISKVFTANTINVGQTTSLTFTIANPPANSSISLGGIAFTDNFPAGLVVASAPNLINTCGGSTTATAGTSVVSLSGGVLAAGSASCTLSVSVAGATVGTWTNSVTVASTNGGTGNTSSANIAVDCAFSLNPISNPNILADDGTPLNTLFSISVSADPSCTWSAAPTSSGGPNLPWLNIQSGSGPITGNGTVTYTVTNNIGPLATAARNGKVTFTYAGGPTNYPVTQAVVVVSVPSTPTLVEVNNSAPFTATVNGVHGGTDSGVTWSQPNCATAPCGTLMPGPPYTANPITYNAPTATTPNTNPGPVTLKATSNFDSTKSSSAPITVTDFSLAFTPNAYLYLTPGGPEGSATITLTATAINGYLGTITPKCPASLPAGVTCSFSGNITLTGGAQSGTSTLTLAASSAVLAGNYPLIFTGTDAATTPVSHTVNLSLYVVTVTISTPYPYYPGTIEVAQTPQFTATANGAPNNAPLSWTWAISNCTPVGSACGTPVNATPNPATNSDAVTYDAPAPYTTPPANLVSAALTAGFTVPNGNGNTFSTSGVTSTFPISDYTVAMSPTSGTVIQGIGTQTALTTEYDNLNDGYPFATVAMVCAVLTGTTDGSPGPGCTVSSPAPVSSPSQPTSTKVFLTTTAGTSSTLGTETGLYAVTVTGTDAASIPVSHLATYTLAVQCGFSLGNSSIAGTSPTLTPATSAGAINPTFTFYVTEMAGGSNCAYGNAPNGTAVAGGITLPDVAYTQGTACTAPNNTNCIQGVSSGNGIPSGPNHGSPVTFNIAQIGSNATPQYYSVKASYFQSGQLNNIGTVSLNVAEEVQVLRSLPTATPSPVPLTVSSAADGNPNNPNDQSTYTLTFLQTPVCSVAQLQSDGTYKVDANTNFGITCTAPTNLTLDGPQASVSGLAVTIPAIQTASLRPATGHGRGPRAPLYALWLGVPGLTFLGIGSAAFGPKRGRRIVSAISILLLVSLLLFLPSCGGGFSAKFTPPGSNAQTYVLTIMGTVIDSNNNVKGVEIFTVPVTTVQAAQ